MIVRIVRMSLSTGKASEFKSYFKSAFSKIKDFEGCLSLELFEDTATPDVFITLSRWETHDHLENYRKSELFKSTWSKVKPLFKSPAISFSMGESKF